MNQILFIKQFVVLSTFNRKWTIWFLSIQIHNLSTDSWKMSRISPGKKNYTFRLILSWKTKITGVSNSWLRNANTRESAFWGRSNRLFNLLLSYCKIALDTVVSGIDFYWTCFVLQVMKKGWIFFSPFYNHSPVVLKC